MDDREINSAEKVKEKALDYLHTNYDDTFYPQGYSSSNWAYKYSSITFLSEKYSELVEVRVYKGDDETYIFKDNYYHLFMMSDAKSFFLQFIDHTIPFEIKVRFPNAIWSDELGSSLTFDDWRNNGNCNADVFFISYQDLSPTKQEAIVTQIAKAHISGTIYFFKTNDSALLANYTLNEILNNQVAFVENSTEYFIHSNYEISKLK